MSFLLGVDLGTRACKTLLFDFGGSVVAESIYEYPVLHPKLDWAEQDPNTWWKAAVSSINDIFKKIRIESDEIAGIGVDSQREAVAPIDKHGKAIWNAIIWLDTRTLPQADKINKLFLQEEILKITGQASGYIYSAPKILWLIENKPGIIRDTKHLLFPKDYLTYRLTGEKVTDFSMASRTLLFDINKRVWSDNICDALEIERDLLPEIRKSGEIVGEVCEDATREVKLKAGIPVVAGGGDRPCEALGAGVTQTGQINIGTGTGTTITAPLDSPNPDPSGRIACCCHVIKDMWEYEAGISTTGASLRWFMENFEYEKPRAEKSGDTYLLLEKLAQKIPIGSDGLFFYPYLSGAHAPYFNDRAKGIFLGLTLGHGKGHFIRSIFEGVAFQYPPTFELLIRLGVDIDDVRMVGRETISNFWNQLKSDVTGESLILPKVKDSAALGSAILAGIGTGIYRDEDEAVKKMVKIDQEYNPNKKNTERYMNILGGYAKKYKALEKAFME